MPRVPRPFSKIKFFSIDVDGVLTDGAIYYGEKGELFKKFNVRDGLAIQKLIASGIKVAFLSSGLGRSPLIVKKRARVLGVKIVYCGTKPKHEILEQWRKKFKLSYNEIAHICDDVNDLEIVKRVGLSACPSDAAQQVKKSVKVVLEKKGGEGCVREFMEKFLLEI